VLLALLDRPGQLATRDELRQRLWPADTFVDFEHALNAALKRLRDALGDSADTPRYKRRFHGGVIDSSDRSNDKPSGLTSTNGHRRPN
jgi:DNA-binding winged helix-turn-helix (wHTH) protein